MPLLANDLPLLRVCSFSHPSGSRDGDVCRPFGEPVARASLPRDQLVSVTSWNAQPND